MPACRLQQKPRGRPMSICKVNERTAPTTLYDNWARKLWDKNKKNSRKHQRAVGRTGPAGVNRRPGKERKTLGHRDSCRRCDDDAVPETRRTARQRRAGPFCSPSDDVKQCGGLLVRRFIDRPEIEKFRRIIRWEKMAFTFLSPCF